MKNKILTLILFASVLINAEPKRIFQSENNKNKTVSSEKMINVDSLKKRYFSERFIPYKTLSPTLLKIFQKFDITFIGFFEAKTEAEQIKFSKQLIDLQKEYSNILPKGIKNEYTLCIAVLDTFMPKK